ncbi:alpha/beta fold hydrolase [Paraburkholderia tagetis]|uniref:Alpha/beta hydrolase n=1 Tax=Paraburkholderia tagetis TaxID=2913261 RepID=A0A9X1RR47_9BURK|nr:alpha/beta hydrolase [Paraburkholderia tagetis]MCG5074267.1 alpha/beta hydrolase [Paraburkholderia tagetis]
MTANWILLRGLTRESRHWGAFAPLLQARCGAVLPIDLPGNGALAHLCSPVDVDAYVNAVRAEARRLGVQPPHRVLAMSLGGMVASAWARRFPDEIERLVLVNTSMRPYSRFYERLRPGAWPALLRAACHWRGADSDADRGSDREVERDDIVETMIHARTCARRDTLAADLDAWCAIRASARVSRANALRQLLAAARYTVRGVPLCPVLVLSSREDRLVDPVCSARLARAWGATHREHPWAGHDLPHDDPQWVVDALCAAFPGLAGVCETPGGAIRGP